MAASPPLPFSREQRVRLQRDFAAVYAERVRKARGPLVIFARLNDLERSRLGLSVPRRVGTAVARNRIKRLLREAFRLQQHELPRGLDLVVTVRPHQAMPLDAYKRMLAGAAAELSRELHRRRARADDPPGAAP